MGTGNNFTITHSLIENKNNSIAGLQTDQTVLRYHQKWPPFSALSSGGGFWGNERQIHQFGGKLQEVLQTKQGVVRQRNF